MNKLYKFTLDCGGMGMLDGIFVEDDERVKKILGKEVFFGEALGKHSEIFDTMREDMFEVLTDDQDFISKFNFLGCWSGHNPFDHIDESELEDEDSDKEEE